jgi:hypothetical protein
MLREDLKALGGSVKESGDFVLYSPTKFAAFISRLNESRVIFTISGK